MTALDAAADGVEPAEPAGFNLDDLFRAPRSKSLRRLPRLIRLSFSLVWRAAPREFLLSAGLQLFAGIGVAAQLLVGRAVLVRLLRPAGPGRFGAILPGVALLAVVTAVVSFANLARTEQQRTLGELVSRYAIGEVLDVATSVDLLAYESPGFHDRLQRAQVNANVRPLQMASGLLGFLSAGFAIAGIASALLFLQPIFLLLVAVAYVPVWFANRKASRVVYDFTVEQTERDRRRSYLFLTLCGKEEAKEVRAFNLRNYLRQRHDRLYDERIADIRTVARRRLVVGLAGGFAASVLTSGTIAVLVWFVTSGRMPVASAGAAAGAVILLGQRLQSLTGGVGSIYESSLFLEDFTTFVEAAPALRAQRPTGAAPAGFDVIRVDDVWFTYPSRKEPSLRGASLEINRGEIVALVGENGSGKTTLAKLLAGLYGPTRGSVTWDGVDISTCDPDALRSSVAVIFQDFVKYQLTVRENIAMGRHERADDDEGIRRAAREAGADIYLRALDDGYETRLGPQYYGGSDLSIGQWQRIALARAFFRDAPFIILDEPTASLDARAEYELFEKIRDLFSGRTVLLISHRFSSVRAANRIYVLEHGEVTEHGTHDELMRRAGHYAELFTMQAAAYLDLPR